MGTLKSEQFAWTDQRCDQLRALYADGLSSGRIAIEMGGLSRNAVIGKVSRLGLVRDGGTTDSIEPRKPRHKPKPTPRRHDPFRPAKREQWKPHVRLAVPPTAPEPMPDTPDEQIPHGQRRTLMQLENYHCRWPCGHPGAPDFFFCGALEADLNIGIPYCRIHGARASAGPGRAPDRFPWGARAV